MRRNKYTNDLIVAILQERDVKRVQIEISDYDLNAETLEQTHATQQASCRILCLLLQREVMQHVWSRCVRVTQFTHLLPSGFNRVKTTIGLSRQVSLSLPITLVLLPPQSKHQTRSHLYTYKTKNFLWQLHQTEVQTHIPIHDIIVTLRIKTGIFYFTFLCCWPFKMSI